MAKYYDKNSDKTVGISNEESRLLTRECITTALIMLMREKPYSSITVSELCKKAGVSRGGFYRNYKTKDDILDALIGDGNVFSSDSFEKTLNVETDPLTRWTVIFERILHPDNSFTKIVQIFETGQGEVLVNYMNALADKNLPEDDPCEIPLINAYFWVGALSNLFTYWIKSGKRETPRQLASFIVGMFGKDSSPEKTDER